MPVTDAQPTPFESAYQGTPPWDIGRPQPALVAAADEGLVVGEVLDVGCGTGEHALEMARRGHAAWGVDAVPAAIERARAKARERGLDATFAVGDARDLSFLGRTFDAVIDSGLFHVFSDPDRVRYERSLAAAVNQRGLLLVMCFSDLEPDAGGPRRVTQQEIRATFERGWRVESIRAARFASLKHPDGARAWLAAIRRMP